MEEKKVRGKNARSRTAPGVYRQMASRVKSWVKFTQQLGFDRNYDRVVATELSVLLKDPQGLERAAKHLETLAASLRKIRDRRR